MIGVLWYHSFSSYSSPNLRLTRHLYKFNKILFRSGSSGPNFGCHHLPSVIGGILTHKEQAFLTTMRMGLRSYFFILFQFLSCHTVVGFVGTRDYGPVNSRSIGSSTHEMCYMSRKRTMPIIPSKSSSTKLAMWSNDEELRGTDRFKACVPYILPLLDGDQFGYYIYQRIPPLGFLNDITIGPLANIYHAIPFMGIALFLALTVGTRFNTDMDRNVRFNAQQAALIDVALIFPELISSGFVDDPAPRYLAEPCANFVWYAYMTAVVYSIVSNLRGRKPEQIPYISPWADLMVGPF